MMRALWLEFFKTRRRHVWLIVVALIAVQCLWSMWGASRMNAQHLISGWLYFLYQFPLLDSILMPVLIAVLASRLCDVEHKGQTLRLLESLMPAGRLFDAKFMCGAVVLVVVGFAQVILIFIIGRLFHFPLDVPIPGFGLYLLFTTCVNLALLGLQQTLSFQFPNQVVAFSVGILGAFFGLFSLFFPPFLQKFLPWGYYGVLMTVGMNWDPAARTTDFYWTPVNWMGWLLILLQAIVIYMIGRNLFVHKEC
jgi:lantibiotic transport system permease protein